MWCKVFLTENIFQTLQPKPMNLKPLNLFTYKKKLKCFTDKIRTDALYNFLGTRSLHFLFYTIDCNT